MKFIPSWLLFLPLSLRLIVGGIFFIELDVATDGFYQARPAKNVFDGSFVPTSSFRSR